MAVLMVLDWRGTPASAYDRVNEIMGIHSDADAPGGLIDHVAAADDGGVVICDAWESEEALGAFAEERLRPAIREAGIDEVPPRVLQAHNRVVGSAHTAGALVLIEIAGFGAEAYDQMTRQMDAHVMEAHPAVVHTAALTDDGMLVADVWSSPEAFGEFAQTQIAPAAESVGLGEIEPRVLPVHNRIRGKALA